ncbi:MAG TPA: bifunctional DNA-formamidopyrimidine glycosylase/DNA-(apurinic or apyrimidinic site) lyase [Gemmataceae bacterium]|nr:bifunctional DNA-formamidopyrimidine glycosylase/DNA-(apurinic or apyrimidinic site) lyase [Gemmataceae bacterium]
MPELPEVETVVRDLRPLLIGRRIRRVWVGRPALRTPWKAVWTRRLVDRRIETIRRRGKWIVVELDDGQRLVVHLGMTGQLTGTPAAAPIEDHTHRIFDLDDASIQLRFRDVRRFGGLALFADEKSLAGFFVSSGLGPEPFGLDPYYWRRRLGSAKRCLKAVLLDQTVAAGVGNIYADEALFEARLHPGRIAAALSAAEAGRLRRAVETVLNRAIERRGSSIRNYVGGSGLRGEMQNEFRVYSRTGQPCPRCGAPIERLRLAGRSSHFCPACQKSCQLSAISRRPGGRQRMADS